MEILVTKNQLAELGGSVSLVSQYTKDGTIPSSFYYRDDGSGGGLNYAPVSLAVMRIMEKLSRACGNNSPLPKKIVKQIIPQIEAMWHDATRHEPIKTSVDGVDITIQSSVIAETKELLSLVSL